MPVDINKELLENVIEIAHQAAGEIMEIYSRGFNIEQKDDRTPLTEADLAAHKTIVNGLSTLTPDLPILSEESSTKTPFSERQNWQQYWLVDPLDGTREFIKRNGEFTVNIALIESQRAVLGVIVVPVTGVCYFGGQGVGAFKRDEQGHTENIKVRDLATDQAMVIAGSRSHGSPEFNRFIEKVDKYQLISIGSSLKSCLVAEGKADIYARLGPTSEWDTGAAQAVVEAAGGAVYTLDMKPLLYNSKESILNPHFLVIGDLSHPWQDYLE